jgi:hypothetical protein
VAEHVARHVGLGCYLSFAFKQNSSVHPVLQLPVLLLRNADAISPDLGSEYSIER